MDHMGVCFVLDFLVFQNVKRKMDAREARGKMYGGGGDLSSDFVKGECQAEELGAEDKNTLWVKRVTVGLHCRRHIITTTDTLSFFNCLFDYIFFK